MESQGEGSDCLEGLTIVVTGVFNAISREQIAALITKHGARNTGSVSGKTDYLIAGYKLEDGREVTQGSKYNAAQSKKVPILSEDEFEKFMQVKTGNPSFTLGTKLPDLQPIQEEPKVDESPVKNV